MARSQAAHVRGQRPVDPDVSRPARLAARHPEGAAVTNRCLDVISVISHDLGQQLGCYGAPDARTPNLARGKPDVALVDP